jgi:2-polyprenyl-3-methyl-5-hydroxy-6-metoxy-1,4-benzoquinol methylase
MNKEINKLNKVAKIYQVFEKNIEFFYANKHLDVILSNIKGINILEVGCSVGIMTRRLSGFLFNVTVVEASKKLVEHVKKIKEVKDVKFIVSLFEDYKTKEKFSDIIMASLLEHVENPIKVLKKAKSLLEDEGRIHIIVPNANSIHRKIGKEIGILKEVTSFSEGDKILGHRMVYTKELLKKDILKSGLKIDKISGIFLKPFSDIQMEKFDKKIWDALFEVGKDIPEYCSTLYFVCSK